MTGNRSKRPIAEGVILPPGQPIPPWTLSKEAKREWDRLCATLAPAGILATTDADALASWAESISLYVRASRDVARQGPVIAGPNGVPMVNPAGQVAKQAMATMQRYQVEFGATPSARMKVKGNQAPAAVDPFDAFLAGKPALDA